MNTQKKHKQLVISRKSLVVSNHKPNLTPLKTNDYVLTTNSGLSLIEFIVYFAVISVVVTISLQLISQMLRISERNRVVQEVTENARFVNDIFSQTMRGAKFVCEPTTTLNDTISVRVVKTTILTTELTACVDAGRTESKLSWQNSSTEVGFCNAAAACVGSFTSITTDRVTVTALSFNRVNTGSKVTIQMTMTIEYKNPNNIALLDYSVTTKTNAGIQF